ncbi:unnamed protein product, partial [marine sediment metagenome]
MKFDIPMYLPSNREVEFNKSKLGPLLSVLMPCNDQVETVGQAVKSVLDCGYPNL